MELLKQTFEQAYTHLSRLVDKVEQGLFLEESEFFGVLEQLTRLDREQKRCVLELALEGETELSLAKIEEIQAIRAQRRELEEKVEQLRAVARTFLSVRYTGEDGNCRQDLERFQSRMARCSDEELAAMDESQELDHYRQFNTFVAEPPQFADCLKVTQYFGYPLAMALLGKQMTLSDEEIPAQAEDPAAEEPVAEEPVEEPVAEEPVVEEEPVAEEAAPEEPVIPPPVCDPAALGELKKSHSGKNQGIKVLERLCQDTMFRLGANAVPSELYNFSVYTPDMEAGKGPAAVAAAKNFADKLYKDGFLYRFTLDLLPGTELYCLSPSGKENIDKRPMQDFLMKARDKCDSEEPHSAADYVRLYYGEELFGRFDGENDIFAMHTEGNGYALVSIRQTQEEPVEVLAFPAILYVEGDPDKALQDLDEAVRECVAEASDEMAVYLASVNQADSFGWADYFRATGAIPDHIPILCGTAGSDEYIDAEGNIYSLNARIEQLRQKHIETLQAIEAAARQAEEAVEEAVEETIEEIIEETEPAPEPAPRIPVRPEPVCAPPVFEDEPEEPAELDIDIDALDSRQISRLLLDNPSRIRERHLLLLTARLISERQLAPAAAMAEFLAKAPGATPLSKNLYRAFRQSTQFPGGTYHYTGNVIDEHQNLLPGEDSGLKALQQTMVLAMQLWAMVFPTNAFDHALYNNATMVLNGEVEQSLSREAPQIRQLLDLLSSQLKTLSFKNDGLGFSADVLSKLADDGERKQQIQRTCTRAGELRRVPTSTVGINGLETCLKRMVGLSGTIGEMVEWVSKDDRSKRGEIRRRMENELCYTPAGISDEFLEEYIDSCWNDVRRADSNVKVKRLENDTPARKVCKKALEERAAVIIEWLTAVEAEQNSQFLQHREDYARLLNQVKTGMESLRQMLENGMGTGGFADGGRAILLDTVCRILERLSGESGPRNFYRPLAHMLELPLNENGEPEIIFELYGVKGLEPWLPVLDSLVRAPQSAEDILDQIDRYSSPWYRNYGTEALLHRYEGTAAAERTAAELQVAEKAACDAVQQFKSETRLNRAYGKIQEHLMETAFSTLDLVQTVYFRIRNYGGFAAFLERLKRVIGKEIRAQARAYRKRVDELKADAHYEGAPIFEVIENALADENFVRAESYINRLKNGEREITPNERAGDTETDYFAEFQSCEDAYYSECQKHKGAPPGKWGENSLRTMGERYQHWTSANESKNGYTWLKNWVLQADSETTRDKVRNLINGLGFQVEHIVRNRSYRSSAEVFEIRAKKTSSSLKDYPHPIYKFGTELTDPMYVVCLYGCKGSSTVINVMTNELQLNGSTIVLMDGSLNAADRRRVAAKFKADTSGQSPFLLIDRVLLLYLASLDQGDRLKAMLCCTLPYTFEVLYGNGTGIVPEELFIGRVGEMNNLRDRNGPMLVYGGRQLGKTALLNRASRTLHLPENKEYSFCVEVKDEGSGELLEKLNQQLCRLELIPAPSPSISHLCQTLSAAYAEGRFKSLQIFVDEVDILFEEFKAGNYEAVRPFIVVRDDTKSRVKFVFAGTHNVADTSAAEKNNNNLIHMGAPLCIEPLSTDDATKLIRRPLSYLGFQIGQPQIELILSNTNSYPGLIHMFCNSLIQSVCRDYNQYYSGTEAPPYLISDEQMIAVFKEKDIRKEIGKRVMATIELNQRYHVVSCMLARMVYEDMEQKKSRLYGYSAEEILEYNGRELELKLLANMETKDLVTLLNEMVRMGILWKNDETGQFRFRQQDFLSYIGTDDTVIKELFKAKEMEG